MLQEENDEKQVRIQLFTHSDTHNLWTSFKFSTIDKLIKPNTLIKIGRKVDKKELTDNLNDSINPTSIDAVTFKSKVVSRAHAEFFVDKDGNVTLRDVGSSSGTFLNRLRLSPSGKKSSFQKIKSGDIVQLGVDYQGRQEVPKKSPLKLKKALFSLLAAMNNTTASKTEHASCTECCICLCSLSPYQALFLAPCSHCFHYKCVIPLLQTEILFQCPLCRQVANLDNTAFLEGEDDLLTDFGNISDNPIEHNDAPPPLQSTSNAVNEENEEFVLASSSNEDDVLMDTDDKKASNRNTIFIAGNSSSIEIPLQKYSPGSNGQNEISGLNTIEETPFSPSTPISHHILNAGEGVNRDRINELRSRLIQLSIEFPGYLIPQEVDKLLEPVITSNSGMISSN
ncbi:hypothetical protein HDU92_007900 [Lobulomyces angularis]|nr:hypothetical protein HDU92_007900 [Lobulomyces angularis]